MTKRPYVNQLQMPLSGKIRTANRSGNLVNAFVVNVHYDRVTIQLGNNGSQMRGLRLVGGPVEAGDPVQVDFSTDPPVVTARGVKYLSQSDLDAALAKIGNQRATSETIIEIVHFSGGTTAGMYPPSTDGLQQALGVAVDGDVIFLPDLRVSGTFNVPNGVTLAGVSCRETILFGLVTLGENSALDHLKVVATGKYDDTNAVLVTAVEKQAIITHCEIHGYHCAAGHTIGIDLEANAMLDVSYSMVVGYSLIGSGDAFNFAAGSVVNLSHSRVKAKSNWYAGTGTVNVFSVTEGFEESLIWCGPPGTDWFPSLNFSQEANLGAISTYAKKAVIPTVAANVNIVTGGSSYAFTSFARKGNYIYCVRYVSTTQLWIREISIVDGTTVDLQVPWVTSGGLNPVDNFTIVDERKLVSCGRGTAENVSTEGYSLRYPINIYELDFSAASVTLIHQIYGAVGPEPVFGPNGSHTGADYWWETFYGPAIPYVTKNNSGDIILAITGPYTYWKRYQFEYDPPQESHNGEYAVNIGLYMITHNWTQGGAWTETTTFAFDGTSIWPDNNASIELNQRAYIVDNRYLVIHDNFLTGYTYPPFLWVQQAISYFSHWTDQDGNTVTFPYIEGGLQADYLTGNVYNGCFVFDMLANTGQRISNVDSDTSMWAGGVSAYATGIDHPNQSVFFAASPDSGFDDLQRVWRLDIAAGEFAIHYTAPTIYETPMFVNNMSDCYMLLMKDTEEYIIFDAASLVIANPAFIDDDYKVYNSIDNVMDDDGRVWTLDVATDSIIGVSILDDIEEDFYASFDLSIYSGGRVICFGDVFILIGYGVGTTSVKIIRSA